MQTEILILSNELLKKELKDRLESLPWWSQSSVTLKIEESTTEYRGVDPTVLVAVIGVAGLGLSELIKGLFTIMTTIQSRTMILKGKDRELVLPVDTPPERIDELIKELKKMDVEIIEV